MIQTAVIISVSIAVYILMIRYEDALVSVHETTKQYVKNPDIYDRIMYSVNLSACVMTWATVVYSFLSGLLIVLHSLISPAFLYVLFGIISVYTSTYFVYNRRRAVKLRKDIIETVEKERRVLS